jgi:hypothetical protein
MWDKTHLRFVHPHAIQRESHLPSVYVDGTAYDVSGSPVSWPDCTLRTLVPAQMPPTISSPAVLVVTDAALIIFTACKLVRQPPNLWITTNCLEPDLVV